MNDLHSFVTLLKTNSLTQSAKLLGVSKSTLSRRITHLEETVGQPLLLRQASKMTANDAGKAFLPFAWEILDAARRAQKTVDTMQESVIGELNIAVYSGLIRSWFPKEIVRFTQQYPDVRISLNTFNKFEDVSAETDACIWLGTPQPSKFKEEMIGYLTCGLYASKKFMEKNANLNEIEDLNSVPWVNMHHFYLPEGDLELMHSEDGSKCINIPRSRIWSDQIAMQLEEIARGYGVGVLPDYMVAMREKHHAGDLVRVFPQWKLPMLPMYLLYPYGSLPKRLSAFLHHFRNQTREILGDPKREK
ncbi:LysR family transcriptional regulator [Marinomonas pollencensis]|nr:LysR family transcriptional regulator [Marinomonas pollencensis]